MPYPSLFSSLSSLFLAVVLLGACGDRTGLDVNVLLAPPLPVADASPPESEALILFGGTGDKGRLDDTWRWDGAQWTRLVTPLAPSPRDSATLVPLGSSLVLVGGYRPTGFDDKNADTWIWNGTTWAPQHPSLSPPSINGAAAGSLFGRVVLFGGWPASNLSGRLGGTWLWDSASWTKEPLDASTAPFGIAGATLGSTIVTFGGEDDWYEPTSNSSTWDGTKWTALRPAHVPDARRGASMAAFRGKVVLFGGEAAPNLWVPLGDTWTWDGSDWTKVTLAVSPPARAWSAMAATKNGVVLFGGSTIGGGPGDNGALGDTWVWDGASWTQRDVSGPSPRSGAVMAPL